MENKERAGQRRGGKEERQKEEKGAGGFFSREPSWRGSSLGTFIMVFPVYFRSSYSLYFILCDSYYASWIVLFFLCLSVHEMGDIEHDLCL